VQLSDAALLTINLNMKQILIPFKENADIPEAHLYALKVCNSATSWHYKKLFYNLKNEILKKYGHEADYDLQTIKKPCHSCGGKGVFKCHWKLPETCWSCLGDGVYQTKKVVLKRYLLNGAIFHEPIGELFGGKIKVFDTYEDYYPTFKYELFNGKIVNEIQGLIKHETIDLNATWSFYYLLWNYNREEFYKSITHNVNYCQTRTKYKLKKMLKKANPLKVFADFLKVKPQQLEQIDDLPF